MSRNLLFLIQFTFHRPIKFSPFTSYVSCDCLMLAALHTLLCREKRMSECVTSKVNSISFFFTNLLASLLPVYAACMYITYISSHLFFIHSNLNVLHWWLLNWSRQTRQQDREAKYEWNARNQRQTSQHLHISNLSFQMEKQQQLSSLKAHDFMICTQLYQTKRRGLPEQAQKTTTKFNNSRVLIFVVISWETLTRCEISARLIKRATSTSYCMVESWVERIIKTFKLDGGKLRWTMNF